MNAPMTIPDTSAAAPHEWREGFRSLLRELGATARHTPGVWQSRELPEGLEVGIVVDQATRQWAVRFRRFPGPYETMAALHREAAELARRARIAHWPFIAGERRLWHEVTYLEPRTERGSTCREDE